MNAGRKPSRGRHREEHAGISGPVLVASCACILTVAIVGSAVFLGYRIYERHTWQERVRTVVASLQNRTPDELAETAAQVKSQPKLARLVLPEVLRSLRQSKSEQQQGSVIRVLRAFINHERVERALFRLRRDSHEGVAAAAVEALCDLQPPDHAAAVLGRCLDDAAAGRVADAAVDEACAGLYRLGEPGCREMRIRLPLLSVDRRIWLVGYAMETEGPQRKAWLEMLRSDAAEAVQVAAEEALARIAGDAAVRA